MENAPFLPPQLIILKEFPMVLTIWKKNSLEETPFGTWSVLTSVKEFLGKTTCQMKQKCVHKSVQGESSTLEVKMAQ